jgi:hypothetical protein
MNARRLPDWQLRLAAYMAQRQAEPFAWGQQDCALFAAGAVLAITGHDPAADLRGSYAGAREALAVVADRGGLEAIATAALGPPINPRRAAVGDVVLVAGAHGALLAVCNGTHALAPGDSGLVPMPMAAALSAWKVG